MICIIDGAIRWSTYSLLNTNYLKASWELSKLLERMWRSSGMAIMIGRPQSWNSSCGAERICTLAN
jgi:hypothetical protein